MSIQHVGPATWSEGDTNMCGQHPQTFVAESIKMVKNMSKKEDFMTLGP